MEDIMPQSTSAINACDVVVRLADDTDVIRDISGSSNDVSIEMSNQIGSANTFSGSWAINKSCKKSAKISLKALYTTDEGEAMDMLKNWYFVTGGSRTLQINVPDNEIGSDRYSGLMILESMSIGLVADDAAPIPVSASLQNDGEFSLATIAS
jgi:hypothetical protein